MSSDEYATILHPDRSEVRPRADDPFVGDLPELAQGDVQLFRICKALRRSGDQSQFTRSWLIDQLRAIQQLAEQGLSVEHLCRMQHQRQPSPLLHGGWMPELISVNQIGAKGILRLLELYATEINRPAAADVS
jgi:hypothetical protein